MRPKILICDNEEPLRNLVRASLDNGRYEILEARESDEGIEFARAERPDLIVLDMMMPVERASTSSPSSPAIRSSRTRAPSC